MTCCFEDVPSGNFFLHEGSLWRRVPRSLDRYGAYNATRGRDERTLFFSHQEVRGLGEAVSPLAIGNGKMRIGISGCGYWGANVVRTLLTLDGVTVEAIADPDPGARQRVASLMKGNVKTHSKFDPLLADRIDGIVIASPPAFHVEQAVAALKRGKAVLVEKPPAMSNADLMRLLDAAEGKMLMCDYVYCYNPLVRFAKGLMQEIDFKLVTADLRWTNWGIVRKDVDAWWSVAPHPVSVLVHLFRQTQMQMEWVKKGTGWARAHLVSDGGAAGFFVSWHHPVKGRRIELVGENQTILIEDVERKLWVMSHDDEKGRISIPHIDYVPSPLAAALQDFVQCAMTGREPVCGVDMIKNVTRLMLE